MGFLFGLFIGATVAGGGSALPPASVGIPFACLAAFEISDNEYLHCRWEAVRRDLNLNTRCSSYELNTDDVTKTCSMTRVIKWELAGLRSLRVSIEKTAATGK